MDLNEQKPIWDIYHHGEVAILLGKIFIGAKLCEGLTDFYRKNELLISVSFDILKY